LLQIYCHPARTLRQLNSTKNTKKDIYPWKQYTSDSYEVGKKPLKKQNIFVEGDWMKGHKPSRKALELVMLSFYRACKLNIFITLHIDEGCMGGGNELKGDEQTQIDIINFFYRVVEKTFSTARLGVFHHAYISSLRGSHNELAFTICSSDNVSDGDDIFILCGGIRQIASDRDDITEDVLLAHTFMHELGHNLGLVPEGFKPVPFEGIDRYYPTTYRSCMNYNDALIDLVDYSDGARTIISNGHDFDDWGHIRLRRVATKWDVVE